MKLFKKKKKEEKLKDPSVKSTIDKKEISKLLKEYTRPHASAVMEESNVFEAVKSREYKDFQFDELQLRLLKTMFEKACAVSSKLFKIQPSPKAEAQLKADLEYLWFAITPGQVMGLGFMIMMAFMLLTFLLVLTGVVCAPMAFVFAIVGLVAFVKMPKYVSNLATQKRKRSMGEMPMVILYMVMYIRNNPVVEGAVRFAAFHLSGPIALDFRKLMWDVEVRKYLSVGEALDKYTELWSQWDKEFADSMKLIQGSIQEPDSERRRNMLSSSVDTIIQGTSEKMRHYTQDLKMPLTVLHAIGIVLPIMGLVMFPMVVMFMSDMVSSSSLFMVYDVFLAGMVLFFGLNILQSRPATSTLVDEINNHPDIPPPGCHRFKVGDHTTDVKMLIPALLIGIIIAMPGLIYLMNPRPAEEYEFRFVLQTLSIIVGVAVFVYIYFRSTTVQRVQLREDILELERELPSALFQLGNRLMVGVSLETAILTGMSARGKKINELFGAVATNMENMNLTFEQALFHPQFGVMKYYPSKLVTSIMKVLVESSKKGMKQVAFSMVAVSEYLKKLHEIEEEVKEILGETASSMEFQASFLAPAISGVVVGLGIMIMQIIISLHEKVSGLMSVDVGADAGLSGMGGMGMFSGGFLSIPPTSPEIFQLVVGIYMLEASILLTYFATGVSFGRDRIKFGMKISKSILIGVAIYSVGILASAIMFGGLIKTIVF